VVDLGEEIEFLGAAVPHHHGTTPGVRVIETTMTQL